KFLGIYFMIQSYLPHPDAPAHSDHNLHVAIIMDGNGRWAERRGLPRQAGHQEGAQSVRRIVDAAPTLGIDILTLFAFSGDNWRRPAPEIATLMAIFQDYLSTERQGWQTTGIRVNVIGRRDQLSPSLRREAEITEAATARNSTMQLRIAIDYSARDAIVEA